MSRTLKPEPVGSIAELAGERARNLFLTRQLYCSEAVLVTLNHALDGGLTRNQARSLAAPFSEGIGRSGCLCGGLSGALMAIGLFLGHGDSTGRRKKTQAASWACTHRFKLRFGSTCCRVLARPVRDDPKAHFKQCADLTGEAARVAAELILEHRPEVIRAVKLDYLNQRDTRLSRIFKAAGRRMGCSWADIE